jgi:Beta-lactamase enzyme family
MDATLLSGITKLQAAQEFGGMPPPLQPEFVPDAGLQDAVDEAAEILPEHGLAIVDLSDDPSSPRYAGYQDTKQALIGSLAKLLPLYGAFELRRNLRAALTQLGISDLNALAEVFRGILASRNGASGTRPLIEKLFTISSGGDLDFTFGGPAERYSDLLVSLAHDLYPSRRTRTTLPNPKPTAAQPRVTRLHDDTVLANELTDARTEGKVPAEDQLRLMAGWSDNVSAAVVIQALGFNYLWALATRSGLYRRSWKEVTRRDQGQAGPGGLCLIGDYNYGRWKSRPREVPNRLAAGTARSIAVLMTMLAGVLVDSQSSFAMREMMRRQSFLGSRGEGSAIGRGMEAADAGWDVQQPRWEYDGSTNLPADHELLVSKIGVTTAPAPESRSNALIVRKKRNLSGGGQKTITAVLVYLNWTDGSTQVGEEFGKGMAAALKAKHNLA